MKLWTTLKATIARIAKDPGSTATVTPRTDTEYTAEIVRVAEILPHPNADRLEIAKFELKSSGPCAYEVVTQKGTTKPGDLMAYFSVDCVLPTDHPEFKFLTTRLDGAGKTHYRLRAARLRGVFSQGLLVGAPAGAAFGDPCADSFGVTYYRAPEPEGGGAVNVPRKPQKQPFPVYGVDSLKKLPRLFEEGEPVVVTEKIHGTNFRFGWVRRKILGIPCGWKFVVGSHRVIKGDRQKGFYGEDIWQDAAERMDLAKKTRDYRGYTFYGELYGHTYSGKKIQDLTYGRKPEEGPGLVVFDVRTPNGDWLTYQERCWALTDCDLRAVPCVDPYRFFNPGIREMAEGTSRFDPKQIREGVVIESLEGPRRKAKYVGEGYLTRKES